MRRGSEASRLRGAPSISTSPWIMSARWLRKAKKKIPLKFFLEREIFFLPERAIRQRLPKLCDHATRQHHSSHSHAPPVFA